MELDRAYVINGSDLHIALAEARTLDVSDPLDLAEWITGKVARPLGTVKADVIQTRLAEALDGFYLCVLADGREVNGCVANASLVAKVLTDQVSANAAHEDEDEPGEAAGAHIHCEHAPGSRAGGNLGQADQIIGLLDRESERHVKRTLRFVWDYLTDTAEPPF